MFPITIEPNYMDTFFGVLSFLLAINALLLVWSVNGPKK